MKEGSKQFEEALKRLESIVNLLEGEEVSLDDALKRYEEGIKLARFCAKKLQDAEKKIEVLSRDGNGRIVVEEVQEVESSRNRNKKQKKSPEEDKLLF